MALRAHPAHPPPLGVARAVRRLPPLGVARAVRRLPPLGVACRPPPAALGCGRAGAGR